MNNKTIFFVVGRLGKTLVYSKVIPFLKSSFFDKVFIFGENKGIEIDGAIYITIPESLKKIKIKVLQKILIRLYEPIQLLLYSIRYKTDYINGIYTLPAGLNALIVAKIRGCKSIVSVIGGNKEIDTYKKPKFFWKNLNIYILKKTDIVTTTGSKVSNYLIQNKIKDSKIFIYKGFVDTEIFRPTGELNNRDIDILFVGAFRKLKGPDRIVEMIKKIKPFFPDILAVFLGTGYLFDYIQNLIVQFDLIDNIKLLGQVDATATFYQRAKVLVMPSRSEGLSTAMLEAMACGCIPVVSNVGNMTDAAHNNINSFVIENYRDIDAFVEKIKYILMNEKIRKIMMNNAINIINSKYSLEAQKAVAVNIINFLK